MRRNGTTILIVLALLGAFVALYAVVPRFEARWADLGVRPSRAQILLIRCSHFVVSYGPLVVPIAVALVLWVARSGRPTPRRPGD